MRLWKVLLCRPLCPSLSYAQVSEPSPVQNDPAFEAAADYSARRNHNAFLVYWDGVLVYETYRDFGQSAFAQTRSEETDSAGLIASMRATRQMAPAYTFIRNISKGDLRDGSAMSQVWGIYPH
jgi:hypothetical protein